MITLQSSSSPLNTERLHGVPRQRTPYTCGPAAVSACLYAFDRSRAWEPDIYRICDARPEQGTENHALVAAMEFAFEAIIEAGEGVWHGGLAVANILNPISSIGHFVVLLARDGDAIQFYDPYWGTTMRIAESELNWVSGDGRYSKWVANAPLPASVFSMQAEAVDDHPEGDVAPAWKLHTMDRLLAKLTH